MEPSLAQELKELPLLLLNEMMKRREMVAIRFEYGGMSFRACYADDVMGRAWFLRRIQDRVILRYGTGFLLNDDEG